ncbi:hypothetical protein GCM10017624_09470 [Azotobacter vinelandii]|nr:hypothetical protein GCM10017624_09470 [Azotobacter vinelandii]
MCGTYTCAGLGQGGPERYEEIFLIQWFKGLVGSVGGWLVLTGGPACGLVCSPAGGKTSEEGHVLSFVAELIFERFGGSGPCIDWTPPGRSKGLAESEGGAGNHE